MASYDSDSSMDDENYTETNVLLGYASKEPTDDSESQLGGYPSWLDPSVPPSAALARCKVCNDLMTLLLQLNGDLPDRFPGHERRLYLFNCQRKTCRRKAGSVRAIRGVRVPPSSQSQKAKSEKEAQEEGKKSESTKETTPAEQKYIGESLFGAQPTTLSSNANPFSTTGAGQSSATNPFSTAKSELPPLSSLAAKPPQRPEDETLAESFAAKVKVSSDSAPASSRPKVAQSPVPQEAWPANDKFPKPYPSYYLDADYEALSAEQEAPLPAHRIEEIDSAEGSSSGGGSRSDDKEGFESTIDKTFQRFADRLAQNPEQVLRYEFSGQPLLYSKTDAVGKLLALHQGHSEAKVSVVKQQGSLGLPRCTNCGGDRVFELQLTPQAIAELEADITSLDGMDWGTIIVGVCSNDCHAPDTREAQSGYVEEWVGVQWEELAERK
ncbi:hypothetical protein L228DRAFT_286361 [Xylona heveae TC161]|uniref:Programmed cell death protein 2 C-terminal domain-containing protein n=1 Tax=Xylona heveae (strain CBS 132557 / TC161) TaxID=1328760 RepID=A0A164ZAF4_XYLHT|nr:hypothetical protein L228DRAFT_286361 [Xylona heveae TC161]KZF18866.1 hypothetical protein L228DRAFT_286361 [Xylona heveae TC161]